MSKDEDKSAKEALETAQKFIIDQIKKGADKETIKAGFEEMGVSKEQSDKLVDTLYPAIMQTAREQEFVTDALSPAVIGGVLASILGGAIWGAIVIFTGYEVGIVAWGIGLLSGAAVVLFTRGKKGLPLQVIAVISGIAGIGVGKYVSFYYFLKQAISDEYGANVAAQLSILSVHTFQLFSKNFTSLFGGFDILWVVLAVITAWRIPQGLGIKAPVHTDI